MPSDQRSAWERLGERLMRRRVELDPRYRNRRIFVDERAPGQYKQINTLERGQRSNYEPATLAAFEQAYDLEPGAIRRFLETGELEAARPATSPLHAVPASEPDTGSSLPDEVLADFDGFRSYVPRVLFDQKLGRLTDLERDVMSNSAMSQQDRSWLVAWFRWGDDGRPGAESGASARLAAGPSPGSGPPPASVLPVLGHVAGQAQSASE